MTEPEAKPLKRNKSKDKAVETSIEEKLQIINICDRKTELKDEDISCHIISNQKPAWVNVETATSPIYIQSEDKRSSESEAEVDFRLTSSREMDSKFRTLFSTDNFARSSKINEKISEELSERNIEPEIASPSIKRNLIKDYADDMDLALKQREKDEKSKLKSLLKTKRISDRTYKEKREFIEKWVEAERKQIIKTKNILIQGWMKANEIISHLEKDKHNVSKIIKGRREVHSPTSQSTSKISSLSFWRSNNSFGQNNKSSLSNIDSNWLNYTYEDDVWNNLRRRVASKWKHLKFNINNQPIKKDQKSESKLHDYIQSQNQRREQSRSHSQSQSQSQESETSEEQKAKVIGRAEIASDIPKKEKSSESINWEYKEEQPQQQA